MRCLDDVLEQMDLEFVGNARHKIAIAELIADAHALLLDVRTVEEVATVALPYSHYLSWVNIPLHCLPKQFQQIPKEQTVGIFCPHSVRAAIAYAYLRSHGYRNVYVIEGGYAAMVEEARPGKVLAQLQKISESREIS